MNESLKERVIGILIGVAPDIDASQLVTSLALRDQVDFDSMDTLHFAIALKKELGIDVPDADFRELASVDRCVQYLQRRMQT